MSILSLKKVKGPNAIYFLDLHESDGRIHVRDVVRSLAEAEEIAKTDKRYKIRKVSLNERDLDVAKMVNQANKSLASSK